MDVLTAEEYGEAFGFAGSGEEGQVEMRSDIERIDGLIEAISRAEMGISSGVILRAAKAAYAVIKEKEQSNASFSAFMNDGLEGNCHGAWQGCPNFSDGRCIVCGASNNNPWPLGAIRS